MKKKQPVYLIPIALLLLITASCVHYTESGVEPGQNVSNTNFQASDSFYFEISPADQENFVLSGIDGSVTVISETDRDQVIISGIRRVKSESTRDAERYLDKLEILVNNTSNEIYVETEQPEENYGRRFEVFYSIEIPDNQDVEIAHVNGDVFVDTLNGDLAIATVNGNITISDLSGNLDASLVNGEISATVTIPENGHCNTSIVNGRALFDIPESTNAMVDLSLINGAILLSDLTLSQSTTTNTTVKGQLGNGNGEIKISLVNGNIVLNGF